MLGSSSSFLGSSPKHITETSPLFPEAQVQTNIKSLTDGLRCYLKYQPCKLPLAYRSAATEYLLISGQVQFTNPRTKETLSLEPGAHVFIPANTPFVLKVEKESLILFSSPSTQPLLKAVNVSDSEIE